jgi:hypothetical protein
MGRMGNQMFQYACAKNLEIKHGYVCSMDDLSKLEYFELAPGEHWKNKLKSKYFFHVAKRLKGMDVHNLQFEDMLHDYAGWLTQIKKPAMVWAFFQSERYFKDSAAVIRHYFNIKKQYQVSFNSFLQGNKLEKGKYNAIHLRRTDYKGFLVKGLEGDDFTLPASYYEKAMKLVDITLPLVIVSDDPEYCLSQYGNLKNVIISKEDAITDFQILSNAKELVISNSTFAWWAAWLNPFATKILCPEYFLGFKENKQVPINIYPEKWLAINVY